MKKHGKIGAAVTALLLSFALSGCGEALVDLTPEEEAVIVAYGSHIVSKYNKRQPDGVVRVFMPEEETEETEETSEEPEETSEEPKETEASSEEEKNSDEPKEENAPEEKPEFAGSEDVPDVELGEFLGYDTLKMRWTHTEVTQSYVSNDAMSFTASNGFAYVVLTIKVTNEGAEPKEMDILSLSPQFMLWTNGREKQKSSLTIVPTDFSTYRGTIGPGETVETQIFFQRALDRIAPEDRYALDVTLNGQTGRVTKTDG